MAIQKLAHAELLVEDLEKAVEFNVESLTKSHMRRDSEKAQVKTLRANVMGSEGESMKSHPTLGGMK